VRDRLFADDLDDALWYLRRAERVQRVLTISREPVSTITATEFSAFRDELGSASGIQSYMYRPLEFALGNKDARMAEPYRPVYQQVEAALRAPRLYDAAPAVLRRHGLGVPADAVERDFAEPYRPRTAVQEAGTRVLRSPRGLRAGRSAVRAEPVLLAVSLHHLLTLSGSSATSPAPAAPPASAGCAGCPNTSSSPSYWPPGSAI